MWLVEFSGIGGRWNIPEDDLQMAHPSCLRTIQVEKEKPFARRGARDQKKHGLETPEQEQARYDAQRRVQKLLWGRLLDVPLDFNGHWRRGVDYRSFEREGSQWADVHLYDLTRQELAALETCLTSEVPEAVWHVLGRPMALSTMACPHCAEDRFYLETDGRTIRIAGPACEYPDGIQTTTWELNVPSGALVVANDLREWFPLGIGEDGDIPSINTVIGCQQTALAYAAVGLAHGIVGNSCPGVYQLDPKGTRHHRRTRFKIANPPSAWVEDPETGKERKMDPPPSMEGTRVAGICTDLWWFSICDRDELLRRMKFDAGAEAAAIDDAGGTAVPVRPGVYRFIHNEQARADYGGAECVYTTFEWVREPDPVQDFMRSHADIESNAHAYVQAQTQQWPSLYGEERRVNGRDVAVPWAELTEEQQRHAWGRVADHIFNVIGGGTAWHEKGFPLGRVDPAIADTPPPSFREQLHWYPFSENYSTLWGPEAPTLSPSFARLAFEVLESIISFGMAPRDGDEMRGVAEARKQMRLALCRYRQLAAKYPGVANSEYVAWVTDGNRADKWVEAFDLGPELTQRHRDRAAEQIIFPEGIYAVAFYPDRLPKRAHHGFCWHQRIMNNQNSNPEHAHHFRVYTPSQACGSRWWEQKCAVPRYVVARVGEQGIIAAGGKRLIEITFDYGTAQMRDSSRKALEEYAWREAIVPLTEEEYEARLPGAIAFHEATEADVDLYKKAEVALADPKVPDGRKVTIPPLPADAVPAGAPAPVPARGSTEPKNMTDDELFAWLDELEAGLKTDAALNEAPGVSAPDEVS